MAWHVEWDYLSARDDVARINNEEHGAVNYRNGLSASRAGDSTAIRAKGLTTASEKYGLLSAGLKTVDCKRLAAAGDVEIRNFNVSAYNGRGQPNSVTWDAIVMELKVLTCTLERLIVDEFSSGNDGHPKRRKQGRNMRRVIAVKIEASCQTTLGLCGNIPQSNDCERVHVSPALEGTVCMSNSNVAFLGHSGQGSRPSTFNKVSGKVVLCKEEKVPPFCEALCNGKVVADVSRSFRDIIPVNIKSSLMKASAAETACDDSCRDILPGVKIFCELGKAAASSGCLCKITSWRVKTKVPIRSWDALVKFLIVLRWETPRLCKTIQSSAKPQGNSKGANSNNVRCRKFSQAALGQLQRFSRHRKLRTALKSADLGLICQMVNYLGHMISEDGIHLDKHKIAVILAPKTVKEIRHFIELVGYYRTIIPNFSKIAQPLRELTYQEGRRENAISELCKTLCLKPVLQYPDFSLPFFMMCDKYPICFISRQLNKVERNYSTTERECLCVVFPLNKWRYYLYGRKFTVVTDQGPLKWLLQMKELISRLARWSLLLSEYDFDIVHKTGKAKANADVLSRISVQVVTPLYKPVWAENCKTTDMLVVPVTMQNKFLITYHNLPFAGHQGIKRIYELIK
ncbi:hypothetical protein PR048_005080 [Dryococelus australis]|uniref:Reverse transcriptase RNase H-like domain-containing protein n=1 Tax=Dryococelus australis TaxID=614101 RepID=A0ABQ9I775_9NEOP|nr:hypothetical protein PR048_005080 [Dryococelus australis]